ncbi:SMC protein-like protein [Pseudonocardia sp. Ae168_Ps1]|uniref:AAA family ATPase n=1 Tax=unclassified Pseudonocardia TaxID=2619320 RepID=UPI00094B6792|nr:MULTISPECIES: AAA family ATPase [unclassified Pseudonocardia]OLL76777.1 SMC protein-like protein [Pseudonocardia sp. Ae150A_Ps1]OLL82790.1 SMC protein-like protein [Pseudonocardia sp. Ae168_Ps1]OLL83097.1 SMC protein-like protein [Pseudonocardia sp. Ae263_Ps1]OLL90864.1 SMC protein-like protein [Pseudonocardia sp. Ae356_Ps1]
MTAGARGGHFVARVSLAPDAPADGYPFDLPAVRWLREHGALPLYPGVTFLVGENGSGKSTLVEALAVAIGLNPEGGSRSFRFATRGSESDLGAHLRVARRPGRERTSFFLRAESYYNVATEVERLDRAGGPPLLPAYGGSGHERSHGESFVALLNHRFGPRGLYLLDEPEAALSLTGALAVLRRMTDLTGQGSQFVVATHSPVLLALPGATILEIGDDGAIRKVGYDDAAPVVLTRGFLADPDAFLRHL